MAKFRMITHSQVAAHPHHSIAPRDYIFSPEYVMELVKKGTKQAMEQLQFMIKDGQATKGQIRQVVKDKMGADREIVDAKYSTLFMRVGNLK